MNTVVVDGVTYTKAKEVSKKYHYTTDYLGQLCRAGKIDCQLVGRAWYINTESVQGHKNADSTGARENEKAIKNNYISVNNQLVEPRLRKHTISPQRLAFLRKIQEPVHTRQSVQYESDSAELIPKTLPKIRLTPLTAATDNVLVSPHTQIKEGRIEPIIPVIPIDSEAVTATEVVEESFAELDMVSGTKIPITSVANKQKIQFTRPPAIPLKGSIKVRSVADPEFMLTEEDSDALSLEQLPAAERKPIFHHPRESIARAVSSQVSQLPTAPLQFLPQTKVVSPRKSGLLHQLVLPIFFLFVGGVVLLMSFISIETTIATTEVSHRLIFTWPF
jgi:hypothetical protein